MMSSVHILARNVLTFPLPLTTKDEIFDLCSDLCSDPIVLRNLNVQIQTCLLPQSNMPSKRSSIARSLQSKPGNQATRQAATRRRILFLLVTHLLSLEEYFRTRTKRAFRFDALSSYAQTGPRSPG
ncbi:hypothetical protein ACMFMF_001508 [Clarireedia jacksonii]